MPKKSPGKRPDGRWMRQCTHAGKRYTVYGKTSKEVQEKLAALKARFASGLPLPEDEQTFASYLPSWLKTIKSRVAGSTLLRYESIITTHFLPAFGDLRLSELTPLKVQTFYAKREDAGSAAATVRQLHTVLHHALADAVDLELLAKNPCDKVKPPKLVKHKVKALSVEQVQAFLSASADDRLHALFVLAVKIGPRESELLALHWDEVDIPSRVLTVRYGLQRAKNGYVLAGTKSEHGERTITLPMSVVEALKVHKEQQTWEKKRAGRFYQENNLVFCDEHGGQYTPAQLVRRFNVYVEQPPKQHHGGPRPMRDPNPVLPLGTTFHQLRKTARTRMAEQGIDPKTAADVLGHGIAVSMDVYTSVTPRMKQQAADLIDEAYG